MGKQTKILEFNTPTDLKKKSTYQLRKFLCEFLRKNYAGLSVLNNDTKLLINVTVKSVKKTAYGEAIYWKKAAVAVHLLDILKTMTYNNFGEAKKTDAADVIGYLNYKCKCKIDGVPECLRIAVKMLKGGKFYYNIEVNKKSQDTEVQK